MTEWDPRRVHNITVTLKDPFGTPVMSQTVNTDGMTVCCIQGDSAEHFKQSETFHLSPNRALGWSIEVDAS